MTTQIQVPQLSKANKIIIGIYLGLFIFSKILAQAAGVNLVQILGLSLSGMQNFAIFQLFTYPLIESGFTPMLFNGLLLWFIGSDLEQKWGIKVYIQFLLASSFFSGLAYLALAGPMAAALPFFGMTGTSLALLMAYGIIYSERTMIFMFIFPMKAKYFCMLLGGIELYMGLFSNYSNAAWAHLVAMASGYGFLKYLSFRSQGWTYQNYKDAKHKEKMKSKLKIVDDKPDPEKPKYWQ